MVSKNCILQDLHVIPHKEIMVQQKKDSKSPRENKTNDDNVTIQKKRKGVRRQYRKLSNEMLLKRISTMQARSTKLEEKLNRSNTLLQALNIEQQFRNVD